MLSAILLLSYSVLTIFAAPAQTIYDRDDGAQPDAPFSVPESTLEKAITCPRGLRGAKGGIVLLVHGTASHAYELWEGTPYNVYLPYADPGFDVCWVELPNRALDDAQVSAEYVAYNLPRLAKRSATQKVAVIGHSQGGGFTIQWALTFWPSIRSYVSDYIALAGDFHGTNEGPLICTEEDLTAGGCHPSILQQTAGSNYIAAQNKEGGKALVPTTSLYTHYDEFIQDENIHPTSILPGAANIALQDANICGPLHIAEHFSMIIDPAAYFLAYDALTHDGPASSERFDGSACNFFKNQTALNLKYTPKILAAVVEAAVRVFTPIDSSGPRFLVEPPLKPYVCEADQATVCST